MKRSEGEVAATQDGAVEARDDRSRARGGGDRHSQGPLLARVLADVETLDQPLGLPRLRRLLLGRLGTEAAADLVVVGRLAPGVLDALLHPRALRAGPRLQSAARLGVLLECPPGVAS